MDVMEKLVEICFHEFCMVVGDSPCGCDGCPYGKYDSDDGECYEEYKNDKLTKLEKAGVTVQEWISVKDRLPKLDEAVLVHPKHLHIKTSYYAVWSLFKCHSGETIWVDKSGDGHNLTEVTHWMPLPQPPKGD